MVFGRTCGAASTTLPREKTFRKTHTSYKQILQVAGDIEFKCSSNQAALVSQTASTIVHKMFMTEFFLSSLVDKRVRDHLHGAGMQILTKQCEDEHDKEILYGPVSLAHKKMRRRA